MNKSQYVITLCEELEEIHEEEVSKKIFKAIRHIMRPRDVTKFLKAVAYGGAIGGSAAVIILLPYVKEMMREYSIFSNLIDAGSGVKNKLADWGLTTNRISPEEKTVAKIRAAFEIARGKLRNLTLGELVDPVPDAFKRSLESGDFAEKVFTGMKIGAIIALITQFIRMAGRSLTYMADPKVRALVQGREQEPELAKGKK